MDYHGLTTQRLSQVTRQMTRMEAVYTELQRKLREDTVPGVEQKNTRWACMHQTMTHASCENYQHLGWWTLMWTFPVRQKPKLWSSCLFTTITLRCTGNTRESNQIIINVPIYTSSYLDNYYKHQRAERITLAVSVFNEKSHIWPTLQLVSALLLLFV